MNALIVAFWLMLPAYIPNNCAALFGGGTPLDWGRIFRTAGALWATARPFGEPSRERSAAF